MPLRKEPARYGARVTKPMGSFEHLNDQPSDLAFERHYRAAKIAKLWNFIRQKVTRIFENEPGVLREGHDESRYQRSYHSLRVPESVMKRVHQRLRRNH